jgi:serine/threonine protein kinase
MSVPYSTHPRSDDYASFAEIRDAVDLRLFASQGVAPPGGEPERRYVVTGRLGAGGMGVVLRAYDARLRREVALKRVRSGSRSAELDQRLAREAQALASLHDPHIVAIHDLEHIDGQLFLVMEYVDGMTLGEWLRAAPRGLAEILDAFLQCARGLAAAHAIGIVHRDFKPGNVLIGRDGRVRITDFGLARQALLEASPESSRLDSNDTLSTGTSVTSAGLVVGTAAYMAPE